MIFLAVFFAFLASTANAIGPFDKPPLTLIPAHPPGHDGYDLDHLVPHVHQSLYFRESGMSGMSITTMAIAAIARSSTLI